MNEFWSRFRWYVIGGGALLVVGAVVLVVVLINAGPEEGPMMAVPTPDGEDAPRTETVPSQAFEGEGSETLRFKAGGGVTVFTVTHEQGQNFIAWVEGGDRRISLFNARGPFEGSRALGLAVGDYILDISNAGSWTVTIDQSIPIEAPAAPKTLEGEGVEVSDFFFLGVGTATFRVSHEGDTFFSPQLIRASDGDVRILANEQSSFSSETTLTIDQEGIYLVNIDGFEDVGTWKIEVTQ